MYNSGLVPHVSDDNKSYDNKGPGQASAAFPPGVYISQFQYGKQHSTSRQMPQKHFQLQGTSDFFIESNQCEKIQRSDCGMILDAVALLKLFDINVRFFQEISGSQTLLWPALLQT